MRRVTNTILLFLVNLAKLLQSTSSRKCSIKAPTKWNPLFMSYLSYITSSFLVDVGVWSDSTYFRTESNSKTLILFRNSQHLLPIFCTTHNAALQLVTFYFQVTTIRLYCPWLIPFIHWPPEKTVHKLFRKKLHTLQYFWTCL